MSLRDVRRHVGRLAIAGFPGHAVSTELRAIAREFDLGGVIYFARNIAEPGQVRELSRECAALQREWPLWISVDQEGGRVARLRQPPFTIWPPMRTLGRSGAESLTVSFANALAEELLAVGINLDFTPVLDVHTNPRNPVIGDRALSERASEVARLGAAMIHTLQAAGVAACGKHFPGHGDTSTDSHHALPIVEHPPERLREVEWVPFRAAIAASVASLMTAHVLVPALDEERPATLSPVIVDGLLKKTLGHTGIVFSDDMGMKAISVAGGLGEACVLALLAGCDSVLLCNHTPDEQVEALEAMIDAVESGRLPAKRIEDALDRQERVKQRFLGGERQPVIPLSRVGCEEHQAVAAAMAEWV
ncbi:MAG: beta-N-acetylhexosaminidase [Acidobacteriota bacterium]